MFLCPDPYVLNEEIGEYCDNFKIQWKFWKILKIITHVFVHLSFPSESIGLLYNLQLYRLPSRSVLKIQSFKHMHLWYLTLTCFIDLSFSKPSAGGGRGMKLGSKAKDVDSFVDQLKSEGQRKCHFCLSTHPFLSFSSASQLQSCSQQRDEYP